MKVILGLVVFLLSVPIYASDIGFSNLNQNDVDDVFEEFAATFTHSTVSGASSKSKIFGVELGLVAGATQSEKIKEIAQNTLPSGSDEIKYLPFASLYGLVSLPFGITVEANFIPEVEVQDIEFSHLSLAGKFELTSLLEDSPVNLAVRGFFIDSSLNFSQSAGGFTGTVEMSQSQFGLHGIVSKKLLLVEPYVFAGIVSASGEITQRGTGTIFNFSVNDTIKSDASSAQFGFGLQANLLIIKTGIEYVNSFGASHVNAKLALSF